MRIDKKKKDILGLNAIGMIYLKAWVYAQDKLLNNEGIMIFLFCEV
ncbi:hypothetical protein ACVWYN_002621 [Pedobacter sp. UYP24]